jgi:hypothetical protein
MHSAARRPAATGKGPQNTPENGDLGRAGLVISTHGFCLFKGDGGLFGLF